MKAIGRVSKIESGVGGPRQVRDGSGDVHEAITHQKRGEAMRKLFAAVMSAAVFATFTPVVNAADCPAEVTKAKELLSKKTGQAKAQDVQAPRSLAGARQDISQAPRGQDSQAPRGQDSQAPRGQDSQAPRGQEVQAPRSLAGARQDISQAPRGQDQQAPRGQDQQAPRGQDQQAPRGQDQQAPRGEDQQARRAQDQQAARGEEQPPRRGGL